MMEPIQRNVSMDSAGNFWTVIEQPDPEDFHLELVSGARKLSDDLGGEVCCIALGQISDESIGELALYGAHRVYVADSPLLSRYCAETVEYYLAVLFKCLDTEMPRTILFADTQIGSDLASRLASRMKIGLVTGCVNLSLGKDNVIVQSKLTHGGNVQSTFVSPTSPLEIVTVKSGALDKKKTGGNGKPRVLSIKPEFDRIKTPVKTLGITKAGPDQIDLDEADIIVAGGRGMGSPENFRLLDKLARLLGGVVAGSLATVDEGWVPRKRLVGQTGMTVEPKLYIACGISGSIYHLLGMKDSKVIVAINTDRHAPIFRYADFGMVGDVMEIIPSMVDRLEGVARSSALDNRVPDA